MRVLWLFIVAGIVWAAPATAVEEYTIAGDFDGCDYGKLYELDGGGILECQEYTYFYEYRPVVLADGVDVILIGNERVSAQLHNGSVLRTHIAGDFEGCDFDTVYELDNGLLFQCAMFRYRSAYRPRVEIFLIEGRRPVIFIDGDEYGGAMVRMD